MNAIDDYFSLIYKADRKLETRERVQIFVRSVLKLIDLIQCEVDFKPVKSVLNIMSCRMNTIDCKNT